MRYIYKNEFDETIEFSADSPFRLTQVQGESANTTELAETSAAGQIGSTVASQRIPGRTLTLIGDLPKNGSYRRDMLAIVIAGSGRLIRVEGTEFLYLDVYVKQTPDIARINDSYFSFEMDLYAAYPFWRTVSGAMVKFDESSAMFKFPKTFYPDIPFMIATKESLQIKEIYNRSPLPAGFVATFEADGPVYGPEFTAVETQEHIKFPTVSMSAGDRLEVSTQDGHKYCRLVRGAETINLFPYMDDESTFFKLESGVTTIQYEALEGTNNLKFSLYFDEIYEGV